MATGNGLRPACHRCCSALERDTLKSFCCFHLTDVQEGGMLQSGCDCEHWNSLLQSCKLLYFYPSFIWRVLWFLQKDITVCLPCCRMTKHLRAKFGINNIVTPFSFLHDSCFNAIIKDNMGMISPWRPSWLLQCFYQEKQMAEGEKFLFIMQICLCREMQCRSEGIIQPYNPQAGLRKGLIHHKAEGTPLASISTPAEGSLGTARVWEGLPRAQQSLHTLQQGIYSKTREGKLHGDCCCG